MPSYEAATIGADLSGLTLALALHQQGINSTIYQSRPESLNIGGAVMLSPNALKILDTLGMYNSIKNNDYNFELLDFMTSTAEPIDTYEFGSEKKYGYKANRIYRFELLHTHGRHHRRRVNLVSQASHPSNTPSNNHASPTRPIRHHTPKSRRQWNSHRQTKPLPRRTKSRGVECDLSRQSISSLFPPTKQLSLRLNRHQFSHTYSPRQNRHLALLHRSQARQLGFGQ